MRLTFVNQGTPFTFRAEKFSKYLDQNRGASMLQIHAELTLDAMNEGRQDVLLLDEGGQALEREVLEQCAKTGKFPQH